MKNASTAALTGLLVATFVIPLILLLREAITPEVSWIELWTSPENRQALWGTLITSSGAAAWALAIGLPSAVLLARTDLPGRRVWRAILTLPAALPPFILGMGWVSLANPKAGLLNLVLGTGTLDIYGRSGIAFVLGAAGLPLVLLPTLAALDRIDASLEEAARLSGAGRLRALLSVSVPLVLPTALSGTALCFLFAASAFGVPYLLGVTASPPTPTLTTRIYGELLMGSHGLARAVVLSVQLLLIAAVVLGLSRIAANRGNVRLNAGKGGSRHPLELAGWKWPLTALLGSLVLIVVVLPLLAVALTSVQPVWGQLTGLTVKHWSSVLGSSRTIQAAAWSVILAATAAVVVTGVGLSVALARRKSVEWIAVAPYAVPGTVLALGWIIAFSREIRFVAFDRVAFVLALGHSLWLLVLAYSVKHLALGTRAASDTVAQLDPSLSEAARVSGANRWQAFWMGTWPQLRGALGAAFLVVFLTCVTELTLSVLLIPTGRDVLGTLLFELQSYADPGSAAVIATAFVGLVITVQFTQRTFAASETP